MSTKKKTTVTTEIQTRLNAMSDVEEKILRMRHGIAAPDDLVLEMRGRDAPLLARRLDAIERHAVAAAHSPEATIKRKIIHLLRRKNDADV